MSDEKLILNFVPPHATEELKRLLRQKSRMQNRREHHEKVIPLHLYVNYRGDYRHEFQKCTPVTHAVTPSRFVGKIATTATIANIHNRSSRTKKE